MQFKKWINEIKSYLEIQKMMKIQIQQQNQQANEQLEDIIHEEAYLYCCELDSPNSYDFQSFLEHTEEQLMDYYCGIGPHPFHTTSEPLPNGKQIILKG